MNRVLMAAALGCLTLAGCANKLDSKHAFTLPQGGDPDKALVMEAQTSAQTVKVDVTATEPVDVYVIPSKAATDPRDLSAADREAKALGSKKGVTKDLLTVKVPAKEAYQVLVSLADKAKKSDVTVRLTN